MAEGEEKSNKQMMRFKRIQNRESWDLFYTVTKCEALSESYAHWPQFEDLLAHLIASLPPSPSDHRPESSGAPPSAISVLVAGCGNSAVSERLYDAGFTGITNVDFSSVVIKHMLMRNVRERPLMKWRVMDLRDMQFANETFEAIVDIGGLDDVVGSYDGHSSGHIYLSEVKRLLKPAGKYICVTLAGSKVLGVVFPRFRFGWKMNSYGTVAGELNQNKFMMVAWKLAGSEVSHIPFLQMEPRVSQAHAFHEALEEENKLRKNTSGMFDTFIPLEDLKANLNELEPGRRIRLTLGQPGVSRCLYNCILLDAQQDSGPFSLQLLVLVVPNLCHLDWITTSSKEQWRYVEHFEAARLLMILMGPNNEVVHSEIQKDISPLLFKVIPRNCVADEEFAFAYAAAGIEKTETVHQVTSDLSGLIVVEDLIYNIDPRHPRTTKKDLRIRCLTVASMVRSKTLLVRKGSVGTSSKVEKKKTQATSKTKKKGKHKSSHSHSSWSRGDASRGLLKVDHIILKSTRHTAMISGLLLISIHLKESFSAQALEKRMLIGRIPLFKMKTVVIGLGAGLLPMFMNKLPYFTTEVAEADPVILDVAREYFDFIEDECLKVHISDGIQFVNERVNRNAEGSVSSKIDILIIDMDSPSQSAVLASPPIDFVEKSFLLTVKNSLSEDGLFIINLVTRSVVGKRIAYERLKEVFSNLLSLEIEDDVNEVIFAINSDSPINEVQLSEACSALAKSFEVLKPEWSQRVIDTSKSLKPLK